MSTPMETNTEELRNILQQVYGLPDAGSGGSGEPDLVIGLNWRNPNTQKNAVAGDPEFRHNVDDVSIESGSVAAVVEKLQQNQPVRVLLKEVNFYNMNRWSKAAIEAAQVFLQYGEGIEYPDTPLTRLGCIFYAWGIPSILEWPAASPVALGITFDTATGAVNTYTATELTHGSYL